MTRQEFERIRAVVQATPRLIPEQGRLTVEVNDSDVEALMAAAERGLVCEERMAVEREAVARYLEGLSQPLRRDGRGDIASALTSASRALLEGKHMPPRGGAR